MTTTDVGAVSRPTLQRPAVRLLSKIGFVLVVLIIWQVAAAAGRLGAVPTPVDVGVALVELFVSGSVWPPLGITMLSWLIAFAVSAVGGIALGFLLGGSRLAYRLAVFVLDFCRTIPALALIPLIVLMFGSKMLGAIVLAVAGAIWAVLLQTIYGVWDLDPVARDTFRSYRVGRVDTVLRLVLPTAAPYIATGLRLTAAICLLLTLSAQLVVPSPGIGQEILLDELGGAVPEMYAYIVLAGVLGIGINAIFVWLERGALHWHAAYRAEAR